MYLDETRIEAVPNKLVEGVWDGLRDRYVLGALRARSFVDVKTFFTQSFNDFWITSPIPDYIFLVVRARTISLSLGEPRRHF